MSLLGSVEWECSRHGDAAVVKLTCQKNAGEQETQNKEQDRKKESRRHRDTIINRINIRLRYASLPSLHGRLAWDCTDRYTHRDAAKVTDMTNSERVLDKIGLRHQEGQRLRTARKEQGLAIVLVPE